MYQEGQPIRLLLVDDHPVVRKGTRDLLDTEHDFQVVVNEQQADGLAFLVHGGSLAQGKAVRGPGVGLSLPLSAC